MRTEFEYASKGAGTIHAYRWTPEGTPIAVLQLVHGIAEHMLRRRWLEAEQTLQYVAGLYFLIS